MPLPSAIHFALCWILPLAKTASDCLTTTGNITIGKRERDRSIDTDLDRPEPLDEESLALYLRPGSGIETEGAG
uniref:Uncharacterized protein n=1 Tax=uncultured prokaryote TaxID=198431 RepID=H5SN63_9ZZZZ|nr:hypothetical protein HGMM_F51E10C11 [uncultured prokaryote]